jgi:hypothetical protein
MSYPAEYVSVDYLIPTDSYPALFDTLRDVFENVEDISIYDFSREDPSILMLEHESVGCTIKPADSVVARGTEHKPLFLGAFVSAFDEADEVGSPPLSTFIDIAVQVYEAVETPVLAHGLEVFEMKEPIVPDEDVYSPELDHFPWLTFFSPERVEQYSREKLLSTPAPRVEELDDGSILIVTRNPLNYEDDSEVAAHLGIPSAKQYLESSY